MKKTLQIVSAILLVMVFAAACAPSTPSASPSASASSSASAEPSTAASTEPSTAAPADSSTPSESVAPESSPAVEGTPSIDAIKAKGKLVMMTNAAFPPFEYLGDDNNVAGVDVDICKAIADKIGVELEVINMEFDGIIPSIQTSKGDIGAAGITIREDRSRAVDFSTLYMDSAQHVMLKADDTEISNTANDTPEKLIAALEGKVIGVQLGTTGDIFTTENIKAKEIKSYKNYPDASLDLAAGRLDAIVIDTLPCQEIVKANSKLKYIEMPLNAEQFALAIAKSKPDLMSVVNTVLDELKSSGELTKIVDKHVNAYKQATPAE